MAMMENEMELLKRYAKTRAEDAFSEIVRRQVDLVYSAALRQVRSPQLAEEVVQSVFIDLAKTASRLKADTILSAWLYHVTRRTAIDLVRREARRQLREQIATEMNVMNATADDWTYIEPLLDDAMQALDESERTAILLRYFENKSLREVGQVLATSEDAAQKRVSRAIDRLREFFAKRGLTVGAGGLVVVISANAVQAAPVGLAVAISTAAALAGTAAQTSTLIATTKTIAMTTVQKTLITITIAAGIVTPFVVQYRTQEKLRQETESLRQQNAQLAAMPAENDRLSNLLAEARTIQTPATNNLNELLRLRAEVGSLRAQTNDLGRLQTENQHLKSSLAATSTNTGEVTLAPKESWSFVGYANPESAFQSAFWAMNQGDAKTLLASLAPGGRESQKVQSTSEEQYLKKRQEQFDKVTAFKIIDKEVLSSDETILTVFLDGLKEGDRYRLQRFGNDWKLDGPYREKRNVPPAQ